jgi:hypothetical protein
MKRRTCKSRNSPLCLRICDIPAGQIPEPDGTHHFPSDLMKKVHKQINSFSTKRCEFIQYWRGENPSVMMIERRNRKVLAGREMIVSGAKV